MSGYTYLADGSAHYGNMGSEQWQEFRDTGRLSAIDLQNTTVDKGECPPVDLRLRPIKGRDDTLVGYYLPFRLLPYTVVL